MAFSYVVSLSGAEMSTVELQQSLHPLQLHQQIVSGATCWEPFWRGSAGDPRGFRWGSAGDPRIFRGIRHVLDGIWPTFWGDPSETTAVFYNFKKGKGDAKCVWGHHGSWDGGEAMPCVLEI